MFVSIELSLLAQNAMFLFYLGHLYWIRYETLPYLGGVYVARLG